MKTTMGKKSREKRQRQEHKKEVPPKPLREIVLIGAALLLVLSAVYANITLLVKEIDLWQVHNYMANGVDVSSDEINASMQNALSEYPYGDNQNALPAYFSDVMSSMLAQHPADNPELRETFSILQSGVDKNNANSLFYLAKLYETAYLLWQESGDYQTSISTFNEELAVHPKDLISLENLYCLYFLRQDKTNMNAIATEVKMYYPWQTLDSNNGCELVSL